APARIGVAASQGGVVARALGANWIASEIAAGPVREEQGNAEIILLTRPHAAATSSEPRGPSDPRRARADEEDEQLRREEGRANVKDRRKAAIPALPQAPGGGKPKPQLKAEQRAQEQQRRSEERHPAGEDAVAAGTPPPVGQRPEDDTDVPS